MKYEQEDPYYLAYRPRRHSHGHLLRDGLGCILQMRRRRKMPYRKQQLPEHSQVRGNDHHDDYRVLYRQELHLQARPHLFADRFRHGSVRSPGNENDPGFIDYKGDFTLLGICFFMVVQALFIYRHTRTSDKDNHSPWILCIPFAVMFIANALHLFSILTSPNIPIIATYGTFLICSLIVACKVPKVGYFPAKNARNIKYGMILFFCCDACVGLSLATGDDHTIQEIVATVANNFVWYFYTPALILLGLSGYKRKE